MSKTNLEKGILQTLKKHQVKLPGGPYENYIQGWWFDEEKIIEANKKKELLTLDLDVGKFCDLNCTFCFADTQSKNDKMYLSNTTKRVKSILDEAKELGLKTIKIVGAGEPFLFKNIFEIIEHADKKDIHTMIFTGGHIIGDDEYAKKVFSHVGINSGKELANKLKNLKTSIVVKYLSFNDKLHMKMVNPKRKDYPYTEMRDKGLLNLVTEGFNTEKQSRLGVDCLLLKENYREAVDLFSLFNKYNIFCLINTSVDCGNTSMNLENPSMLNKDEALEAATALYKYCKNNNIPFDKRISPYFCGRVCSQLNHGLFTGDDGTIKACPGGPKIGSYAKGQLKKIWEENKFRIDYANVIGNKCISRIGKTLHHDFENRVIDDISTKA